MNERGNKISAEALRLYQNNRVELSEEARKAKYKVNLNGEAVFQLHSLMFGVVNQALLMYADTGNILSESTHELLEQFSEVDFDSMNRETRVSFEIDYDNVSRLGRLTFAELRRFIRGTQPPIEQSLIHSEGGSPERHGAAFLDLTEAFMNAGGPDVKSFRLGVEKLMSAA